MTTKQLENLKFKPKYATYLPGEEHVHVHRFPELWDADTNDGRRWSRVYNCPCGAKKFEIRLTDRYGSTDSEYIRERDGREWTPREEEAAR